MPRAAAKKAPVKKTRVRAKVTVPKKATAITLHPVQTPVVIARTYIFAVGRRKEAVARVRWYPEEAAEIIINERALAHYFPTLELSQAVRDPLTLTHQDQKGKVTVKVAGGGQQGQADAVRLGIARALVKVDPDLRLVLKRAGFLSRDPRVKERKKYGLKRARRAPQWQKR